MMNQFIRRMCCWIIFFCVAALPAAETTADQARQAAQGYLHTRGKPFGADVSQQIKQVVPVADADGTALYYIVELEPDGFLLVAADDRIEPVLAISPHGTHQQDAQNPLYALATQDQRDRLARARAQRPIPGGVRKFEDLSPAEKRWKEFMTNGVDAGKNLGMQKNLGTLSPAVVLVNNLAPAKWNQSIDISSGQHTWDLFTPNNDVCGCVATAMAQVMRYYQWPTTPIGTGTRSVFVDGVEAFKTLHGGDGLGGPYVWSAMPENAASASLVERTQMSYLCADVGYSVRMQYTGGEKGSGAWIIPVANSMTGIGVPGALIGTFGYANASGVSLGQNGSIPYEKYYSALRSSLYAGSPAIFGIGGSSSGRDGAGHAIVCAGYGIDTGTSYYYLNFGWNGLDNAWYTLHDIGLVQDGSINYTELTSSVSNIFPTSSGEVVAGTITDLSNAPLPGVTVSLTVGGSTFTQTSTSRGTWGWYGAPANTPIIVTATHASLTFPNYAVTTGQSVAATASIRGTLGNIELQLRPVIPTPPVIASSLAVQAVLDEEFTYRIIATNNPTGYNAIGLPPGLAIDQLSGLISGVPTALGSTSVTITASNGAGSQSRTLMITVIPPPAPAIVSPLRATGMVGVDFTYYIGTNYVSTSFSTGALPPGLTCDITNGLITGVPAIAGVASVTITATNAGGSGSAVLIIDIGNRPIGLGWTPQGNMVSPRFDAAAVAVAGKAWLFGGSTITGTAYGSAEVFNDSTGTWAYPASPAMVNVRYGHEAVTLTDGSVLVIGGRDDNGNDLQFWERWNTTTGAATSAGSMTLPHSYAAAVRLADGRVLVCGGEYNIAASGGTILDQCEIYNPTTGTWAGANSVPGARSHHGAVLLGNSKVLVMGGTSGNALNSAYLFDPATGNWATTGNMINARESFASTLLDNGKVLVVGGYGQLGDTRWESEVYDPVSGTWAQTGELNTDRANAPLVPLGSGLWLIAGGIQAYPDANAIFLSFILNSAEIYDEVAEMWLPTTAMNQVRGVHNMVTLSAGTALAFGGLGDNSGTTIVENTSEQFDFVAPSTPVITSSAVANGTVGTAFTYTIAGTQTPYWFAASPLPAGLVLNRATGVINGVPTTAGSTVIALIARNLGGNGSLSLALTIAPGGGGGGGGGGSSDGGGGGGCGAGSAFSVLIMICLLMLGFGKLRMLRGVEQETQE